VEVTKELVQYFLQDLAAGQTETGPVFQIFKFALPQLVEEFGSYKAVAKKADISRAEAQRRVSITDLQLSGLYESCETLSSRDNWLLLWRWLV
jgi:hypothetical protein